MRQWELALRNSQEASRRNGVVGSTGRNMPSVASPMHRNAIIFKMIFIFLFLEMKSVKHEFFILIYCFLFFVSLFLYSVVCLDYDDGEDEAWDDEEIPCDTEHAEDGCVFDEGVVDADVEVDAV